MDIKQIIASNLAVILGGLVVIQLITLSFSGVILYKMRKLKEKSDIFFTGKDGGNLEQLTLENSKGITLLDKEIQELYNISNRIHDLANKGIHKVGVIRFNPFKDIGGDQSFSVALLDGKDNGFTFSSLHTKEGTRVYAKPIEKGKSEKYQLTDEEAQVIEIARKKDQ